MDSFAWLGNPKLWGESGRIVEVEVYCFHTHRWFELRELKGFEEEIVCPYCGRKVRIEIQLLVKTHDRQAD